MACHWRLWDFCYKGNLEGVKAELAKGADVNGKKSFSLIEHEDIPCLTAAVWSKNEDVVSCLLKEPGIYVDATDCHDYTALHHACFRLSRHGAGTGQREIVKKLLASGANVNCKSEFGYSPLRYAVRYNYTEVVSLLMGVPGLDIETKDSDNRGPLHFACENGNVDIARMLLMCGANVNSRGPSGKTPLMLAFQTEMEDLIFLLLEDPAIDMNAKDFEGKTALHCALEVVCEDISVDEAYRDCIQFLAEKAHVDLDAKDNRGRSIKQIAW